MSEEKAEKEEIKNIPIEEITFDTVFSIDEKGHRYVDKSKHLDSWEEWYFVCYLKELINSGIALDADKNERPIVLFRKMTHASTVHMKTKQDVKFRHLLNGHEYKPDFNINWNPKYKDLFFSLLNSGQHKHKHKIPFISSMGNYHSSIIEVKGGFTQVDQMHKTNMNIKWVYDQAQMYIQLVKVPKIFEETFTPKEYMKDMVYKVGNKNEGIKKGDSRIKFNARTIEEYMEYLEGQRLSQKSIL